MLYRGKDIYRTILTRMGYIHSEQLFYEVTETEKLIHHKKKWVEERGGFVE